MKVRTGDEQAAGLAGVLPEGSAPRGAWRAWATAGSRVRGLARGCREHGARAERGLCMRLAAWALGALWVVSTPAAGQTPSPAEALRVFNAVREGVNAWRVPESAGKGAGDPEVPGVGGCTVVLRLDGQVVGVGSVQRLEASGGAAEDVWRSALGEALRQAESRAPVARDALRDEHLRAQGARMSVSVEVAGAAVPVDVQEVADLDRVLSAGLDGLAIEREGRVAAMSPGQMMMRALMPAQAARSLVAEVAGSAAAALEVEAGTGGLQAQGYRVLKFRVVHAAQARADGPAALLHRGARLVNMNEVDSLAELRALSDALAGHLLRRFEQREPGAAGDGEERDEARDGVLRISTGGLEAAPSDGSESLLAAAALRRYALRPEAVLAERARRTAAHLAAAGLVRTPTQRALALLWTPDAGDQASLRQANEDVAKALAEQRDDASAPAAIRALWALGLAQSAGTRAESAVRVRALWASLPPTSLPGAMPWLAMGEISLTPANEGLAAAVALRELRALIEDRQLTPALAGADAPDFVGGVVFAGDSTGAPTAQSARAVCVLALLLADERLTTTAERPAHLVRLLSGLRFLRQLTLDGADLWMAGNPGLTAGAVRLAPSEGRSSVDATAMTLIAVCEAISAFERLTPAPTPTSGGVVPSVPAAKP